jgi:hypothetical protein
MLHKNIRGKSLHAPSSEIVENNTGITIPKLKVVSFGEMGSLFPQIVTSNPAVYPNFGVTQETIDSGKFGYITCIGFMFDVNTLAWPVNSQLYSDAYGNLTTDLNGSVIAIVVKSHETQGVLYVGGPLSVFRANGWSLDGNSGINEENHFIGNKDYKDLIFKTNDSLRLNITKDGRFGFNVKNPDAFIHIKSHAEYENSGRRIATFGVKTNDLNWNIAYTWELPANSIAIVKVSTIGKTDPNQYGAFVRTTTFRRSGMIGTLGTIQSDYTEKTNTNYKVRFRRVNSTLLFEVQSATVNSTDWTGTVEIDVT